MKILIIGCGKVGYTIAENLCVENHDITMIDTDEAALNRASETLDVMCLRGNGASLTMLKNADVRDSDMVIAVTSRDELNMMCCLAAKKLGAKYTVARIRETDYAKEVQQLQADLGIDLVINPEHATAAQISRLLRFPSAADIDTFAGGRIELVGFHIQDSDFVNGKPLHQIMKRLNGTPILFCAVERGDRIIIPNGSTVLQSGDRAYIIGDAPSISRFFRTLERITQRIRDVLILGGGRISEYLANNLLALNMDVKILELDSERCIALSEALPDALIVCGDGTDQVTLAEENLSRIDAFVALTGRDEDNIITSLYAMQEGVPKVIAKVDRQNFSSVIRSLAIGSIISPKLITAYGILRFVRGIQNSQGSRMLALYRIADGKAEAMEFVVSENTRFLRTPLKNLRLKPNILIALIMRKNKFIIPEGNDFIDSGDRLIIVASPSTIMDINDIYLV